jgi:hypothetical protein
MLSTTPVRLFVAFALIALAGFFAAGATAGGSAVPVLVGVLGMFAAGAALVAEVDAPPGRNRRRRSAAAGFRVRRPLDGM